MKSQDAYATTQTIAGHTVWPCAYGHIHWLTERKNPLLTQKGNIDDFALAEICYAFTVEPKALQSVKGATAKSKINAFLMGATSGALIKLWTHASKEIEAYFASITTPKKDTPQAQKNRKPATQARKR